MTPTSLSTASAPPAGGTAVRAPRERGTVVCPDCQHTNPDSAKFCAGCGRSLWEPCAQCEALNSAGVMYCGQCGANLHESRANVRATAEERLRAAHHAQRERRPLDALMLLGDLFQTQHPVAADLVAEARRLAPTWQQELDAAQAQLSAVTKTAREQLAANEFEGVLATIATVSEQLQDDDLRQLGVEAQARIDEIHCLNTKIADSVATKRYADALAAMERLLALRPGETRWAALAVKIAGHYAQSARKRILAGVYDEALLVLAKVPATLRTPELEHLHDEATELAFLTASLRLWPTIDGPLEAFAERVLAQASDNLSVARQLAQLRLRKQQAGASATALAWATPPERTAVGLPVERWPGLSRIDDRAARSAPLAARQANPFAVACGLALQGLGLATVDTNLVPAPEKRGMLGALSGFAPLGKLGLTSRKKGPQTAWGMELTATGLKVVQLALAGDGAPPTVQQCDIIEHEQNLAQGGLEAQRPAIVAATLKALRARHDLKGAKVCLSLPGAKALARFLTLPPVPKDRIDETVRLETPHQVALPLDALEWDYALQGDVSNQSTAYDVLLVAAKRLYVTDRLAPFLEAGITVDVLQHDAVALHNLVAFERGAAPGTAAPGHGHSALALLDLGCEATNLVISSPRFTWFRSLPLGAHDFTRALVQAFKLTYAQAEHVKREPTRAKRVSRVYQALYPVFDELLRETQRSLASFANQYRHLPLARLDLLGGGALQPGFWSYLRSGPALPLAPLKKTEP